MTKALPITTNQIVRVRGYEFYFDRVPEVHLTSFSNFNIVRSSEDAFKISI